MNTYSTTFCQSIKEAFTWDTEVITTTLDKLDWISERHISNVTSIYDKPTLIVSFLHADNFGQHFWYSTTDWLRLRSDKLGNDTSTLVEPKAFWGSAKAVFGSSKNRKCLLTSMLCLEDFAKDLYQDLKWKVFAAKVKDTGGKLRLENSGSF